MKKIFAKLLCYALFMPLFCCGKDDAATVLNIETNSDTVTISQNSTIEIFIFQNDVNIPNNGQLTLTNPSKGSVSINTNGSTNNPSDDSISYTANANEIGSDTFQYTICDEANNCKTETITVSITSSSVVVTFTGDNPFQNLSQYNFFSGNLKDLNPTFGVIPYDLISPLFSDYAHKKRFIWMPNGVKANYIDDYTYLDFPTGTIIIKNFYFENILPNNERRIIETRLMFKKQDSWDFAEYVWNNEQTEAFLEEQGSFTNFSFIENGETKTVNYRIPSISECFTCHNKFGDPQPIGPKPQNINKLFNYSDGEKNQLAKLIEVGYLQDNLPSNIDTTVDWSDTSEPLDLRARSYIDINCAHCHSDESYCEYRPMRFAYKDNYIAENMGVCVEPDTQITPYTNIVVPNDSELSLLLFRISSVEEQYRMPIIGRSLQHKEGVELIEQWINSLTIECQ